MPSFPPVVVRVGLVWPAELDVLPQALRLRDSRDFRATVKNGVRASGPDVVVHVRPGATVVSRAGFIVSKAVGDAVTRNRVKRQLRHLMADEIRMAEPVVDVVVRALPSAAHGVAKDELHQTLTKACRRLERAGQGGRS